MRELDRRAVTAPGAPAPAGHYSQAIAWGGLLHCSGQVALDPATNALLDGDAAAQAERALASLDAVARAAGARLADAIRCTVYLVDVGDFAAVGAVYARWFPEPPPARVTIGVAALPLGALVEIDALVPLPAERSDEASAQPQLCDSPMSDTVRP